MSRLVDELAAPYAERPTYQMLVRVFNEHFTLEAEALRPKQGRELSASSLQSPDDLEATYRQKRGEDYTGYVVNVTETCHPDNDFQLIVKVQTEANNTDDAHMLAEALPELKKRTDLDQMHTDGGYNSPEVDRVMREQQVEQIQTAIRGQKPAEGKFSLADCQWDIAPDTGQPMTVTAPNGQQAEVEPGRKPGRYIARFDRELCSDPIPIQEPITSPEPQPPPVLYFSQQQVELALRRQRCAQARARSKNPRAAVEATVAAIKRPFGNDKVPVRGKSRVSIMMIGSAAMVNLRRIWRHQRAEAQKARQKEQSLPQVSSFPSLLLHYIRASFNRFHLTSCFNSVYS
jgi:hypothetical protein